MILNCVGPDALVWAVFQVQFASRSGPLRAGEGACPYASFPWALPEDDAEVLAPVFVDAEKHPVNFGGEVAEQSVRGGVDMECGCN